MNSRLDDTLSQVFIKPVESLETEFFVLDQLGLGNKSKMELKSSYSPKDMFRLMKKEYNLSPDNIVKPIAMREYKDSKVYIIERIEGDMLSNSMYKLRKDRKLYVSVEKQLVDVVEKLHSHGYVHGDLIRGNNIMLTNDGKVKLIDPLYIPKNFKYVDAFIQLDNDAVKYARNMIRTNLYEFK